MCVLGASVDLYVVKKMGLNVSLAVSSASCLGASVELYVVKKQGARIDDWSPFGHSV